MTNLPRNQFQITDVDAYFEWERRQQAKVEAALAQEQRDITWGGHFIRPWREAGWDGAGAVVIIFGSVYTLEEIEKTEEPETVERLKELHPRFLFGNCYSVLEPEGEVGDTNRWDTWPISADLFRRAAHCGWDPQGEDANDGSDSVFTEVVTAWGEMMRKRGQFTDEPLPPGVVQL